MVGEPKERKGDGVAPNNEVDFGVLVEFEAPNKEAPKAGALEPNPDEEEFAAPNPDIVVELFVGLGAPNKEPPGGGAEEPSNEENGLDSNADIVFVVFVELDMPNRELSDPVEEDVVAPVPKNPLLLVVAGVVPLATLARPNPPNKPSVGRGIDIP